MVARRLLTSLIVVRGGGGRERRCGRRSLCGAWLGRDSSIRARGRGRWLRGGLREWCRICVRGDYGIGAVGCRNREKAGLFHAAKTAVVARLFAPRQHQSLVAHFPAAVGPVPLRCLRQRGPALWLAWGAEE